MKPEIRVKRRRERWQDFDRDMEAQVSNKKPGLWPESHTKT
jgi:hypothetical protein